MKCKVSIKQVEVYAPASIANLGPGFDVFGLALKQMGDIVKLEIIPEQKVLVNVKGVGSDEIPKIPEHNSASAVLKYVIENYRIPHGFRIVIEKGVPPGKGLGSSGASAAAATKGVCQLLGLNLPLNEYVKLAARGEASVTGSPHADNVSASLLGGFTIVGSDFDVVRIDPPEMEIVVVAPDIRYEKKTMLARGMLPDKVGLKEAIFNVGNAARMAAAVALKDPVLFGKSICDHLIEPYRKEMIPNFIEVKNAALEAGAYGCSIAGGGPSLFAIGEKPIKIGKAMADAFKDVGVNSNTYITKTSLLGAEVL